MKSISILKYIFTQRYLNRFMIICPVGVGLGDVMSPVLRFEKAWAQGITILWYKDLSNKKCN